MVQSYLVFCRMGHLNRYRFKWHVSEFPKQPDMTRSLKGIQEQSMFVASEVVRKESASLVEFLNKISFWRLFGFKPETESNYLDKYFICWMYWQIFWWIYKLSEGTIDLVGQQSMLWIGVCANITLHELERKASTKLYTTASGECLQYLSQSFCLNSLYFKFNEIKLI